MEQPPSFLIDSIIIFRLQKSRYGLKQASRAWYAKIDCFFLNIGFKHCEYDHSIYILHDNGDTLIIVIYVDDLITTGNNLDLLLRLKRQLADTFDMIDIGFLHYFLSLQVLPLADHLFLSQSKYVLDILNHFKMDEYKPCATPFQYGINLTKEFQSPKVDTTLYWQLVGRIIDLAHIRLGILFVVSVVS